MSFSGTYIVFILLAMLVCLLQWTNFSLRTLRQNLYTNEEIFFSKLLFNSWEFKIDNVQDAEDHLSLIYNESKTAVYEDIIKEKIKRRPRNEKIRLIIRRVILISINVLIILIGVSLIFVTNFFASGSNANSGNSILNTIIRQAPALVVTFVNGFVPAVTKKITKAEKYDYANTLLKQQIWRNFSTRLLNLLIFFILNYEVAFNKSYFISGSIVDFESGDYFCREDQGSIAMARLCITEYIVKLIMAFVWTFFQCCKGG